MNGIHEVRGSIPLGSTNQINELVGVQQRHSWLSANCLPKSSLSASPRRLSSVLSALSAGSLARARPVGGGSGLRRACPN